MTAKYRSQYGSRVIIYDPFRVIEKEYPALPERFDFFKAQSFNPLSALDPENHDFVDDAKAISEALITIDNRSEPHWRNSAQALIAGIIMALAVNRSQHPEEANLGFLRKIICSPPDEITDFIKQHIEQVASDYPAIAAKLNRFQKLNTDNKELSSILSTAITDTDWIDSPSIQQAMNLDGDAFDFGAMKKHPVTIYLVLPPQYLETHAIWLRLMITSILSPLIRTTTNYNATSVPVLLMLDEFAQLGHLAAIERNLALMRGYGVKLWFVLQDLSQLKHNYKDRWESFIGNAGVVQAFAPQDVTTREYLAKLSGNQMYYVPTSSSTNGYQYGPGGQSQSFSSQSGSTFYHALVFPEHVLAQMANSEAALFRSGHPPQRTWLPDPSEINGLAQLLDLATREKSFQPLVGGRTGRLIAP